MSAQVSANDALLAFSKALANEKRQQILLGIFTDKQEHTVGEIADRVGIAPSTASEHLAILKRAGVLLAQKRQKEVNLANLRVHAKSRLPIADGV